jgi:CRISPR-associated protein Csb2
VLGHGETSQPRFLLVPVPSIEWRPGGGEVVTAVRRVFVLSSDAHSQDVSWAARVLGGVELIDEKTRRPVALLAIASTSDRALKRYIDEATVWATVTPVVLPGHDDPRGLRVRAGRTRDASEQKKLLLRLAQRREGLVRKALRHSGFSDDLVLGAQIETREVGFFAGVEPALRYAVPLHLAAFPRLHVHIIWPRPVPGPLCIGRGRFSGLGLFASLGE